MICTEMGSMVAAHLDQTTKGFPPAEATREEGV